MREKRAGARNKINGLGGGRDREKVNVVENHTGLPLSLSLFLSFNQAIIFFPFARPLSISSKKCPPWLSAARIFALYLQRGCGIEKLIKLRNDIDLYIAKGKFYTEGKREKFVKFSIVRKSYVVFVALPCVDRTAASLHFTIFKSGKTRFLVEIKIGDFNIFLRIIPTSHHQLHISLVSMSSLYIPHFRYFYLHFYRYFIVHCNINKKLISSNLLNFGSSCFFGGESCKILFARPLSMNSRISVIHLFWYWYQLVYFFSKLQNNRKILKRYTSTCTKYTYGWYCLWLNRICIYMIKFFINCTGYAIFYIFFVRRS